MRIVLAERRRDEKERADQQRRRRWQEAYDTACIAARKQHRADVLAQQVDRLQRLRLIDAYLDAMRQCIAGLPDDLAAAGRERLDWAHAHRDRVDPLQHDLSIPADPELTADLLNPHMNGLSPHGLDGW